MTIRCAATSRLAGWWSRADSVRTCGSWSGPRTRRSVDPGTEGASGAARQLRVLELRIHGRIVAARSRTLNIVIKFIPKRMAYLMLLGLLLIGNGALPATAAQTPDATPATGAAPGSSPATIAAVVPCDELAAQDFSNLPDISVRITSATDIAASGSDPAYCKVAGTLA